MRLQRLFRPAHHAAKRLADIDQLTVEVPGAQTDGRRALHRRAQRQLALQLRLDALAAGNVAPQKIQRQHHAGQAQQRDTKKRPGRQRRLAVQHIDLQAPLRTRQADGHKVARRALGIVWPGLRHIGGDAERVVF